MEKAEASWSTSWPLWDVITDESSVASDCAPALGGGGGGGGAGAGFLPPAAGRMGGGGGGGGGGAPLLAAAGFASTAVSLSAEFGAILDCPLGADRPATKQLSFDFRTE